MNGKGRVRTAARAAGFSERETLIAEQHFKWDALRDCARSMSLFSDKKMGRRILAELGVLIVSAVVLIVVFWRLGIG